MSVERLIKLAFNIPRRMLRNVLMGLAYKRKSYSSDNGKGEYREIWDNPIAEVTIEWKKQPYRYVNPLQFRR